MGAPCGDADACRSHSCSAVVAQKEPFVTIWSLRCAAWLATIETQLSGSCSEAERGYTRRMIPMAEGDQDQSLAGNSLQETANRWGA